MSFVEMLFVNFIYIIFPLFLYLFYVAYQKNVGKKESELFLDFALFLSLYLIFRNDLGYIGYQLLFSNLILVIAYIKRKYISIVLISISTLLFFYNDIGSFIYYIYILEYILYFILHLFLKNKKYIFISIFFIIKLFIVLITFKENVLFSLVILLSLYVMSYVIVDLLNKGEDIISYHMSIKNIEKEKQIRMSLFKITHEIKNPIAVCKGYLDMFDVNNQEHSKKYIPIIKNEIKRTLILLEDFLAMTKIKINKDLLDINFLIENSIDEMESILKANNISINLDLIDDEIYVMGDYNRLMQVFINIIKNSIEAIENKKGVITIKEEIKKKQIYIYIEDNGKGINKETLKQLGMPFYTTKTNGTGLGVSLSKEIINAHNGTMKYFSKENEGTKIQIVLPLYKN